MASSIKFGRVYCVERILKQSLQFGDIPVQSRNSGAAKKSSALLKILEIAHKWKQAQAAANEEWAALINWLFKRGYGNLKYKLISYSSVGRALDC